MVMDYPSGTTFARHWNPADGVLLVPVRGATDLPDWSRKMTILFWMLVTVLAFKIVGFVFGFTLYLLFFLPIAWLFKTIGALFEPKSKSHTTAPRDVL